MLGGDWRGLASEPKKVSINKMSKVDGYRGVLLGLAVGDALGRPVEFKSAEAIEREYGTLTEMVGQGSHGKPAGTVTDDTEQMLCIARSLVEKNGFDAVDVGRRFVEWYQQGPFDIGHTTRLALSRLEGDEDGWEDVGRKVYDRQKDQVNAGAGNGSVMRCPPIALAYDEDLDSLYNASVTSSWITHADPRCTLGSVVLNRVIAGILQGENDPVESSLEFCRRRTEDVDDRGMELFEAVETSLDASEDDLRYTGYVVDTLRTSLYHAFNGESFEDAVVSAVNGGGDTDTVGAVTGALAGARFGRADIPDRWMEEMSVTGEIESICEKIEDNEFSSYDYSPEL